MGSIYKYGDIRSFVSYGVFTHERERGWSFCVAKECCVY